MAAPIHWNNARVVNVAQLSPSVRELQLLSEGGVQAAAPGSHVPVQVRVDGGLQERTYSLVDSGLEAGYRIAVKHLADGRGGSRYMHSLRPGDTLAVGAPRNHFSLSYAAPESLLIAGGIGITPLVGMALALAARGMPLRLVHAVRQADEAVYAQTLRVALGPRLEIFDASQGQRLDVAASIAGLHPQAQLLLCGPLSLLRAAQQAWAAAARPAALLRFETFGSAAGNQAFWVDLPRHGLRVQVPAERSLLQALADAGIEVLADCLRGECGLCTLHVLERYGQIDHRDVFLTPAERQADSRICTCVSRVRGGGLVLDTDYRSDAVQQNPRPSRSLA